ncbi:precorrin-2 C(20)-methyltransferase [Pannonibacter phragmitetus]|uniref:Precorrin-2 C(20)-methyltransferase n=1 Tax=Pannonibacter phragmitetus TaxID=121719 RepID=A0A0U2W1Q6_9HYPH|nr:precorrin-2 C(20)-methyltransferase [Pannonibacter phragmitetus]ALV26506.1 precorrin-2 C(20)-methyltransferase [Pannonibacter phragmitetus]SUA99234.1 Precorrin-2 C(20)-methyltransferase [Pannonibacter phragmitetus]
MSAQNGAPGRLYGVGTGPGDPELMTVKAVRILGEADVIAWFAKAGRTGNGRRIADSMIRPGVEELPLYYPVTTEIDKHEAAYTTCLEAFYEESAEAIAAHLNAGRTVAVLSEGDPMFYGSYMHMHVRLADRFDVEVIPGITAMSGCWSRTGVPIAQGDDVLSVLPGTMAEAELQRRLADTEAAVIMKIGRNLPKVRRALAACGRLEDAIYVERGTMAAEKVVRLAAKPDDAAPYFSLVLVPGWSGLR